MATIKDVARMAEVSVATVSNYLNKTKPVSRQVSTRIEKAIEELHYTQNLAAKSLKTNVYSSVGVILPNLTDSYYLQIFQGIETAVNNAGMSVNLAFSHDIPEIETQVAKQMLQKQVGGLVLISCQPDKWKFYQESYLKQGKPVVLVDRRINGLETSFVHFDNGNAICAVTKELLGLGLRNLTLMAGPENFSCEQACMEGFLRAFTPERGGAPTVMNMDLNKESAFRKTTKLLKKNRPDGIIATSELTAIGIIEAMHVLGCTTEDIPVITMGEEHWNRHTHTFATYSIERPAIQIGARAAQIVLQQLYTPGESLHLCLRSNDVDYATSLRQRMRPAELPKPVRSPKVLRILMLDVPATHTICRMLKNFEDQTGIHAEVTLESHNTLYESILQGHKDKSYDVYMYDLPWLPLLAAGGVLREISPQLQRIGEDAFLPGSLADFGQFGGGYYGIPLMYAPQVLYYRKSLFEDPVLKEKYEKLNGTALCPPRTFTEYNAVAKFFTEETDEIPYGISVAAAYPECLAPELYMRMRAYQSDVIDADGNVVIHNPEAVRAYSDLLHSVQYAKPDYMQATDVSVVADFLRGETAMLISYPGFLTELSDLHKNNLIGSIGCTHIPGKCPLLGGWSLGLSSQTSAVAEAFAFLEWACTDRMSNYFSMLGSYSAVTSTYTNDELVQLYPWRPLYREAYPFAGPMLPSVSKNGNVIPPNDVDAVVCKWLYKMLDGNDDIEQILSETQEELEQMLN